MTECNFDWADLAFESKKPLSSLNAVFIGAPRSISTARFTQLVKEYLPKASIILGLAKESFIDGFEGQPQFQTLKYDEVKSIIDKVNASSSVHKIYTLAYNQRELPFIIEKLAMSQAVFVNGSWHHSFHTLAPYYALMKRKIDYQLISPFTDETEALECEKTISKQIKKLTPKASLTDKEAMDLADEIAKSSFDYSFQTGAILAKKTGSHYEFVDAGFNKVLPYQTYAMHHGASREAHFSPVNDLNHYDTVHAEMALLTQALKNGTKLKGLSLFVNLMPCPNCARTLAETDLDEIVYRNDHSEGYALDLFEKMHKHVRRIV